MNPRVVVVDVNAGLCFPAPKLLLQTMSSSEVTDVHSLFGSSEEAEAACDANLSVCLKVTASFSFCSSMLFRDVFDGH